MNAMSTEPQRSSALDEEVARAEMYGLLATLFYQPPHAELLAQLQVAVTEAPEQGAFLEEPWRALVAAARDMTTAQIAQEHDALFGGVGKPEVYLFGSHYLSGFLNEKPLVQLRDDLAALGLVRNAQMPETEDHVACLFEVMRYLIAGDDVAVCNLTLQAGFFSRHLQPWLPQMCETLAAHPRAGFYRHLARLTEAFVGVETQGFDLLG
jgi:TorA maturation chaperone TorD